MPAADGPAVGFSPARRALARVARPCTAALGRAAFPVLARCCPARAARLYDWWARKAITSPNVFAVPDFRVHARLAWGARMTCDGIDYIQRKIAFHGVWEPHITAVFQDVLAPGDVVIDVGANVGYFTLLASALVGPTGRVVAFEPSAVAYRRLCQHLAANATANVIPVNIGLTESPQLLRLSVAEANNLGSTTARRDAPDGQPALGAPLDALLPPDLAARARLVKLDIEGADYFALRGMLGVLRRPRPPVVLMEFKGPFFREVGIPVSDALSLFAELGYRTFMHASEGARATGWLEVRTAADLPADVLDACLVPPGEVVRSVTGEGAP